MSAARSSIWAGWAGWAASILLASAAGAQTGSASPTQPAVPAVGEAPAPASGGRAEDEASALELSLSGGPSVVFGEAANPAYSPSVERIGGFLTGAVAYRSSYFIDPSLELGYAWLARGSSELPAGPWGEGGTVEQRLGMWIISPGVAAEFWRVRARLGLGLGVVTQSDSFHGQTTSSSQLPLMSQLVVSCKALDIAPVRLDIEGRAVLANGAEIAFVGLGISARFDAIEWGRD